MNWDKVMRAAANARAVYPELREGQSIMNALYKLYPEIYDKVRSAGVDCFYNDDKIEAMKQFIEQQK